MSQFLKRMTAVYQLGLWPPNSKDWKSLSSIQEDISQLEGCAFEIHLKVDSGKGNVGNSSVIEDSEVTPQHKTWIDECSKASRSLVVC
jgi:hypothetical protein